MLLKNDLDIANGPVLADGTALRDLIDFENHAVSMRVLSDPEIYQLELERIWARAWVPLGHESEIPAPGDFMLRYIGEDSVIVTRTREGDIAVLLNVCAHRGMEICWADTGNTTSFKCPYHGWVFDSQGQLLGAPFERDMYGDWDKSKYSLTKARVEVRHGLIFGCFDDGSPSFEDYLGDFQFYLDYVCGDTEWEVLGGSGASGVRQWIPANWKPAVDNNCGDSYHGLTLHHSAVELGTMTADQYQLEHAKIHFPPYGHALFSFGPRNCSPLVGVPSTTYENVARIVGNSG